MQFEFSTVAEYDEEIACISLAITRQLKLGESYENNSGGSSRSTSEAELDRLRRYRSDLIKQRDALKGKPQFVSVKAAW